jgi:hypothetical protein
VRRYDLHGGAHIPVLSFKGRIRPYGSFGLGALWSDFDGYGSVVLPGIPPVPVVIHDQATDLAINFGGGVRYYAGCRFGFRIEFKEYRPFSNQFGDTFYKMQGQVFMRLK